MKSSSSTRILIEIAHLPLITKKIKKTPIFKK
jgi:hypothetical protein